ncbi:hypothetical protein [Salarchaeum sp. JOR-1]|uniref:hypothetical protein n=1 Tax=Salarchaeum sp. JOR-1 TaxID=2599399 RepID=UPI001198AC39|nr:hypothetical protein [Salarchaeum sp. JOR-1]QDX39845.1 hypothetical protein FQU85_02625 [Salarchaeum sp. JOR-1]
MKKEFDPVDAGLTVATMISAFIVTGIASFNLFDVDFGAVAFTLAGHGLSTAYVIGALALAGTILTNENAQLSSLQEDAKDLGDYYYGAVLATVGLMVAWVFVGDVSSFFSSSDLWGLVYVGVVTTGQFVIGWML